MDPYELLDPVEIISKLPKDFYEKLEAKKWQDRKEALDALENLLKNAPKLEPGDYADMVRALKKIITKDSNVIIVALATRLLGMVASGLRNKFSPYATACVQAILEKFKEKKTNVVVALRETIDAIYPSTNLEAISEDMLAAFDNKNPSIKAESSLFLARALCITQPAATIIVWSTDPTVRDAAAEALGTATKLVGEKNVAPHIGKLEPLKEQKIKEFADKGCSRQAREMPGLLPGHRNRNLSNDLRQQCEKQGLLKRRLPELNQVHLANRSLSDGNWKNRLSSVQSFHSTIRGLTTADVGSQVLYRTVNKKPGLKDTNVQVMKARLEACKYITENYPVSTTAADFVVQDIVGKLGETSCAGVAAECLTSLAEACGLEHVLNEGLTMNIKSIIAHTKKSLSATNPNVRTSTVNFLGIVSLYVGPSLINHFDSEKPATKQLISLELDKHANSTPPTPTRQLGTVSKSASKASIGEDLDDVYEDAADDEPAPVEDSRAQTDITPLITETLVAEIHDKNWKVPIITNSSPIKSSLGELPAALSARLLDSNSKLAQSALQICEMLATAMGSKCKTHVRTFFPAFFQAAVSCIETWCREAGPSAPFEGEMISDALKAGSPSFPKEELSSCVPTLFACIEDRAADVRKATADCVLPFMLHLGYDSMHRQIEKLKAALDKARPNLPVQPLPPSKGKKDDARGVKSAGALKKEAEKKGSAPAKGKEFFDLLKEQMGTAGVNKSLVSNMFHSDFRYHLKAIETLSEDLNDNGPALMANLDLVLKWLTLRFFDTNPSVILKGLEYLSVVFHCSECLECIGHLLETYGSSVMSPGGSASLKELARHIGDRDNAVRSAALNCVSSAYFLEGEKVYKMIGQASIRSASLKELARHIGDRDNADLEPPRRAMSHTIAAPVDYDDEDEEEEELPTTIVQPLTFLFNPKEKKLENN
ncbi:Cytoskeleton-associated protein 5 [Operophtera brumata]|uniref:Cytoskeleton-associated protein 5 n=1 Tax=Operophtera brumata TaxID=104452 RepID=A0A0L7L016_OPEBR|nr:Cytoskeleton-associated protein 5 [Operophtera brumata]